MRGFWFKVYLSLHGCKVGSGLKCYSFPKMRAVPRSNINIGDNVTFGYNCTLEITKTGKLNIGNGVNITQNVLLSSAAEISIDNHTLIGENVSIRDANHGIAKDELIQLQQVKATPVNIGKDVWLGANAMILKGAKIPDGIVIGAHSLVLEKSALEPYSVYAGSPVKRIKSRD